MLMLLLHLDNEQYALKSKQVIEIAPLVELKKQPHAPNYVSGVFNYRGQIVPVIDLCQLIQGRPCHAHLSTRIILVNYIASHKSKESLQTSSQQEQPASELQTRAPFILGLMAEQVVETLNVSETDLVDAGIRVETAPYLGKMILHQQKMIPYIRIENLLTEEQQLVLCTTPKEPLLSASHDTVSC